MKKNECKKALNTIADNGNKNDNGYRYEVQMNDWQNYGKDRTYFKIIETRSNSKHCAVKDYGYYDNKADEYVPGKADLNSGFDFGGNEKLY